MNDLNDEPITGLQERKLVYTALCIACLAIALGAGPVPGIWSFVQVAIMIGGPDGLTGACREQAARLWSLSELTLPHGMVRVVLAEQIYRAWTIIQGHPYHREG